MSSREGTLRHLSHALDGFQWLAAESAVSELVAQGEPHAGAVATWVRAMGLLDRGEVPDAAMALLSIEASGRFGDWCREGGTPLDGDCRRGARDPVTQRLLAATLLYSSVSVRIAQGNTANAMTRARLAVEKLLEAACIRTHAANPELTDSLGIDRGCYIARLNAYAEAGAVPPTFHHPCLGIALRKGQRPEGMLADLASRACEFLAESEGQCEIFAQRGTKRPSSHRLPYDLGLVFSTALGFFPPSAGAPFGYGDLRVASHHAIERLSPQA
ncbi:hypothetical protein EON81_06655 [bacterium]|nr:MAG: hypothetical protein EON81_06655 [bacterium]